MSDPLRPNVEPSLDVRDAQAAAVPVIPGHEILGPLGQGGMGVVYKAHQTSLKRTVALKMIRTGARASAETLARFRREAEAVARFQHPNIVQIFQVGETRIGDEILPYLSLEFVDGGSLASQIEGRPFAGGDARKIAQLAETLARAVHVAHLRGIVHRDLKPANVLLTDDGTPKISDFGLARYVEARGPEAEGPREETWERGNVGTEPRETAREVTGDSGALTRTARMGERGGEKIPAAGSSALASRFSLSGGALVGTVGYMAPEQAWGASRVREIGPAADVYGLGVILYEMLTGQVPFRGDTPQEILEQVWSKEPPPPSAVVAARQRGDKATGQEGPRGQGVEGSREEKNSVARAQPPDSSTPQPLSPSAPRPLISPIPRDLETICLKCLRKEPGRRYESAAALAEDLRRFREHEPIQARRVGRAERAWLWSRRKPLPALLSVLLIAVFLSGFGGVLVNWREALEQRHRTLEEKKRADEEKSRAQDATDRALALQADGIREREKANELQRRAEEALYFNRVVLADREWEARHMERTERLLDECVPAAGRPDLRGFEWYYLKRRCRAELRHVVLPASEPCALAYSPDGKHVAVAAAREGDWAPPGQPVPKEEKDGVHAVWLLDANTGAIVRELHGHDKKITGVVFSPDGQRIATSSEDGTVRLCETQTGRLLQKLRPAKVRNENQEWLEVTSVVFSPDGQRLAASYKKSLVFQGSPAGGVVIWNADTGAELLAFTGHMEEIGSVVFSPDGTRIASAGQDPDVLVWDAATGRIIHRLRGRDESSLYAPLFSLAFSPDGERLAAGGLECVVRVWNARTGAPEGVFSGHPGTLYSVAFAPDGRRLASAGLDGEVRVWNVIEGPKYPPLVIRAHLRRSQSVCFSPDGRTLVSVGTGLDKTSREINKFAEVKFWDAARGQDPYTLTISGFRFPLAFSPDSRLLACGGPGATIQFWEAQRPGVSGWPTPPDDLESVRRAERWDRLLAELQGKKPPDSSPVPRPDTHWLHAVQFRDARAVAPLFEFSLSLDSSLLSFRQSVEALAFSNDGEHFAAVGSDGSVRLWNLRTRELRHTLATRGYHENNPDSARAAIVFSPDGQRLAYNGKGKTITVWDVVSGSEVRSLTGHNSSISLLVFMPDGRRLLSLGEPRRGLPGQQPELKLWDVADGQELPVPWAPSGVIRSFVFSALGNKAAEQRGDGATPPGPYVAFVTGDGERTIVEIWSAEPAQRLYLIEGFMSSIDQLVFSADGKRLFTGGSAEICVWDVKFGHEALRLPGHSSLSTNLALSPDGRFLATSGSGFLKIWDAAPLEAAPAAKQP